MRPVPRIVAVCQGGALDGLRFSVAVDDAFSPPPLEVSGCRYRPLVELELADEHAASLEAQARLDEEAKHPVFQGFELHVPEPGVVRGHHFVGVWLFEPEEA